MYIKKNGNIEDLRELGWVLHLFVSASPINTGFSQTMLSVGYELSYCDVYYSHLRSQ